MIATKLIGEDLLMLYLGIDQHRKQLTVHVRDGHPHGATLCLPPLFAEAGVLLLCSFHGAAEQRVARGARGHPLLDAVTTYAASLYQ